MYKYTQVLRDALIEAQLAEFGEDAIVKWLKAHPADDRQLEAGPDEERLAPAAVEHVEDAHIVDAIDYYWGNHPHPQ